EDAYILRAGDPSFIRLGSEADPSTYEIKQRGYYLTWRALATNPNVAISGVRVVDRLLEQAEELRVGARPTHLVSILPGYESNSELVVVRGDWPEGISADQITFMQIARPLVASLLNSVLDAGRQA